MFEVRISNVSLGQPIGAKNMTAYIWGSMDTPHWFVLGPQGRQWDINYVVHLNLKHTGKGLIKRAHLSFERFQLTWSSFTPVPG